ncbi:hypothetical protein GCM10020370_33780 [Paenibacillus hodogayensis]
MVRNPAKNGTYTPILSFAKVACQATRKRFVSDHDVSRSTTIAAAPTASASSDNLPRVNVTG